jgi:arsenite-transporting ATPase
VTVTLSTRLLFFGGKGGVGKTTCAAAAALDIASRAPARAVRLISTDPAPSLGDVLDLPVGDSWTPVPGAGKLEVRELDAAKAFDEYRRRYQDGVAEFFDRLRGGSAFDAPADRAVFERLFDLAPPGLDEVIALLTVVELLEDGADDLLIVDTAPTGHTLRLLALQDDVQRWVALLMQLIIKYRLAGRAESLARDLVALSKALRFFRELLADSRHAQFVGVVRPAALPRLETARLLDQLRALRIAAPLLIINAETTGTCVACRRRAAGERQEVTRLRTLCRGRSRACDIIHAPLHLPPPRGSRDLLAWAAGWRHDGEH